MLDVAGGKGELSFDLLNLHGVPASVLEPRALDLRQRAQLLQVRVGACLAFQGGQPVSRGWAVAKQTWPVVSVSLLGA